MAKVFDEKSVVNRNKIYTIPEGTVILREGEKNLDMYKISFRKIMTALCRY